VPSSDHPAIPSSDDPLPADEGASRRSLVVGAGLLFQAVGTIMALGSCCLWSLSGQWLPAANQVPESWWQYFNGETQSTALIAMDMIITVLGGLAILGAGIGLYGERRRSGLLATWLTVILAVWYAASAVALFLMNTWAAGLIAAGLAALMALLLPLAVHSAAVLRRFPPPADQNVVTPEFRERYLRERAERRKQYDI
jgi:hypothetical protein